MIREIFEAEVKSQICSDILRALPAWFGVEASIEDYVAKVAGMPFYAVYADEQPVGFLAIKIHNPHTAEVCVMGILSEYQRQGAGTTLISRAEQFCTENGYLFLTVKTLDGSVKYEPYEKTRRFYQKAGFIPLEVFPLHWDADNPCLFLAKYLGI